MRRLVVEDTYEGQTRGYLTAYENDIKRADSWDDLKAFSDLATIALKPGSLTPPLRAA